MLTRWYWYRQSTDRAEVPLRPLVPLAVQLLVLELCCALFACLLVLLAMSPLTVHAAVFDQATGRAVPERDGVAPVLAAVRTGFNTIIHAGLAVHHGGMEVDTLERKASACEIVSGGKGSPRWGEEWRDRVAR